MYIEDFYKPIVTKFFKLLINEVEELNDKRKAKDKLNTAFLIAPLAQDINYHFEKYADFAEDLRYLGLVCAEVISNDYKDQVKANIYIDEEEKYYYEIIFDSDTSYLGYCECIKTDKGYREDKPLYKEEIILHLSVDKEDNFVSINVNYANGTVFASFHNPDDRGNNNLYKKVVKAYNKLMSNMKDIFEEIEDENY